MTKVLTVLCRFLILFGTIYIYDTRSVFFSLTELINFEFHKLLPGHLPWLPQVCGKMLTFTTGGNIVENIIIHKIISPFL